MSTVYLARVDSASKLDSYTGLPRNEDDFGSSKSSPNLLQGLTTPRGKRQQSVSPLLNKVLAQPRDEAGGTSSLGKLEDEEESRKRTSSFVDVLESRDIEMDHAWMDMQRSTFANWLNDRLKSGRSPKVRDLSEDLRDGTLLIKLLENLTKMKIKGYTKNPKIAAHKLVNLDLAFDFMRKEEVKLIGIGSLNIFEGNIKLTLGMIWTLIQKYQLKMKGYKVSTKEVLLKWLQALLPSWNITNFTSDWTDGRALIAVINAVKPGIAPDVTTLDPTKRRSNCTIATKVADIHLKIPKIVSADDLSSGNVDERSMMTYISYFVEPARTKLLKWVRKALPRMGITNFTSDWFDGKAFSALVNSSFPGMLPQWMKITSENSLEGITEFNQVCEKRLGIAPYFSSADLHSRKVEEMEIMTLVMRIRNSELKSLPEEVVVSGHGIKQARMGKEAIFFIDTKAAGPGKLFIDSYYEDNEKKVKFKLEEKVSGVLTLSYIPQDLGTIVFDIQWSDMSIANNPFRVEVTDSSLIKILDFEHHSKLREVGQPIELRLDTKLSGRTNLSAHLTYAGKEEVKAELSTSDGWVATFTYTPPKAGKPVLHILLNNTELTHLSMTYTVVDVGGYVVSQLPENRVYQTFEEVSFSVDSSKGLPLDVLQMMAVLTSDIQTAIKFKSVTGNRGVASFKPTLPGAYNVEVACVDKLIQGSPFVVQVTDPLSCRLNGNPPSIIELDKPYMFELDTKNAGIGDVTFECVDLDTPGFFVTTFKEQGEDYFKHLEVRPLAEGEFLVGIKYHDQWIPSTPFRLQVCDPSKFTVSGDIMEKKIDVVGKPFRFKITSCDEIDSGGLKPVVKASGSSAKYSPKVQQSEDDPCTLIASFTPHEIGTHEIAITYGGFHIPSSPFLVAVIDFDSNTCSATGSGLQEAFTNIPAQFVVLTKTAGLAENGTLQVSITGVLNNVECRVRVRDNKNGLYNVAYIVETPGAYLVTILARGSHIAGSPFKLHVQPGPEPDKCRMHGPALEEGAVLSIGKPIDFFVDVSKGGTGKLTVKAVGPGGANARVFMAKSKTKGLFDIEIDPPRQGKYRVNVKWSGQHIPNSPFVLKIFPGVDATKCRAHGRGLEDGTVGNPTSFTIETRDAGLGTLKVCLHRVKDAFKIDLKAKDPKDARTLIARYFPRKPGDYLISILWSEKHIPGSPFKVNIKGEALDGDFTKPNKYKPTPRLDELHAIAEEEEEDDNETVDLDTDFEISSVISRSWDDKQVLRTSASLNEMQMPQFSMQDSRKGYHDTFVHSSSKPPPKSSQSMTKLNSGKMMTFASLQQNRKPKRPKAPRTRSAHKGQSTQGEFHGQATVHMRSKNSH